MDYNPAIQQLQFFTPQKNPYVRKPVLATRKPPVSPSNVIDDVDGLALYQESQMAANYVMTQTEFLLNQTRERFQPTGKNLVAGAGAAVTAFAYKFGWIQNLGYVLLTPRSGVILTTAAAAYFVQMPVEDRPLFAANVIAGSVIGGSTLVYFTPLAMMPALAVSFIGSAVTASVVHYSRMLTLASTTLAGGMVMAARAAWLLFAHQQVSGLWLGSAAATAVWYAEEYIKAFVNWLRGQKDALNKLKEEGDKLASDIKQKLTEAAAAIAGAMGSVGAGLQSTIQQYLYYLLAALGVYVGYKVLTA